MIKKHNYFFKVILIGDPFVGKTSILNRFAEDKFSENHSSTVGVDFKFKEIHNDWGDIKL